MKPFQWAAMLIVVVAQCAFADSISTFKITGATASVIQFIGTGDDLFFVFTGPGTNVTGSGVLLCVEWCEGEIFAPGSKSPVAFGNDDFFPSELDTVKLGGQDFDAFLAGTSGFALTSSGGFTFPVNFKGSTFTACQPAAISSPIPGSVETNNGQFIDFDLLMPPGGKFCSTWDFIPASNGSPAGYLFDHGKFVAGTVPEPGTLGLMASGLAGLVGVILRKRNVRCSRNWQLPTTP